MIKKLVLIVIILIVLFDNSVGREFSSKCHPTLVYWYNQFYDYDKSKPGINERKLSNTAVLQSGDFPVFSSGTEPYLFAVLKYKGDFSELLQLRIEVYDTVSFGFSAKFPLSILPQVDSLPAVEKIYCRNGINTPPIDTIKQNQLNKWIPKDSVDVDNYVNIYSDIYCIDTTDAVPMLSVFIETNGNFSQLDSLGISTITRYGNMTTTKIPINMIGRIGSLETVIHVVPSTLMKLH